MKEQEFVILYTPLAITGTLLLYDLGEISVIDVPSVRLTSAGASFPVETIASPEQAPIRSTTKIPFLLLAITLIYPV